MIIALAFWFSQPFYFAEIKGSVTYSLDSGDSRLLTAQDLRGRFRPVPGATIKLEKKSKLTLIAFGDIWTFKTPGIYKLPQTGRPVSSIASRTTLGGRGGGQATQIGKYPELAGFAPEGITPIAINKDGSLTLVWLAGRESKSYDVLLRAEGDSKTWKLKAIAPLSKSIPLRQVDLPNAKKFIDSIVDDQIAKTVTVTIKNDKRKVVQYSLRVERKANQARLNADVASFDRTDFEGLNAALRGAEQRSMVFLQAAYVMDYFRANPDSYLSFQMLHYLALTFKSEKLEAQLLKELERREILDPPN